LVGNRYEYSPSLHLDDAASAIIASFKASEGIYNICDDEPMTREEMDKVMAEAVNRSRLFRIPTFVMSKKSDFGDVWLRSLRVSNKKFKQETGWEPKYPSQKQGLKEVVAEIDKMSKK